MCVILYKPMGVKALDTKHLQNAVDANTDGWGVVVRSKLGELQVQKGFLDPGFLEFGSSFGEDYDVVAHARIATSGKKDIDNLHPFPIYGNSIAGKGSSPDGDPIAYLLHNGIVNVPEWDESKNDTWHLARIWEATYGPELNTKMRQRGWRRRQKKRYAAGYSNKFVLVDKDGVAIINPTAGLWHEGVWHSNRTALDDPWQNWRYNSGYSSSDYDWSPSRTRAWTYQQLEDGSWAQVYKDELDNPDSQTYLPYGEGSENSDEELVRSLERRFEASSGEEAATQALIAEWSHDNRLASIEESMYQYDAEIVARAVKELLRASGRDSRLGMSE